MKQAGGFAEAEDSLGHAQRSIRDTLAGMRRMLDHERLRKSGEGPACLPVDLHEVATRVAGQVARVAKEKGVMLSVEVRPGTVVESDEELLSLVLQNLVGNGAKFSKRGTVRIGSDGGTAIGRGILWVSDEGPGIAPEQIGRIFEAFKRGEVHGQPGVGLGLAIASQAAKLLGAELTVESQVGAGSTFRLALPECIRAARRTDDAA